MKILPPTYLLAAVLLATAPTLQAQSVANAHSYLNYSPATSELLDEEAEPPLCDVRVARPAGPAPAAEVPADQALMQELQQLTQANLALDFRVGILQAQVELLSRRLAGLEEAAPAEAYSSRPR